MAISKKQLEANRRNAQKSTGPKTPEGKERSHANATTHGLTAAATIYRPIRHEDPNDYQQVRTALIADWNPVGTPELLAVEMIASAYKRMQRAEAMEAAYFDGGMQAMQRKAGLPLKAFKEADDLGCGIVIGKEEHKLTWDNLDRYRRNAWLDYNRAVEQLRRLQKDRFTAPERERQEEKKHQNYLRQTTACPQAPVPATKMGSICADISQDENAPETASKSGPVKPQQAA